MSEPNKPLTPEEQESLNRRVKDFNAKLIPLLSEYKLAIGAIPVLTTDGRIVASPQIFDDSKRKVVEKDVGEKSNLESAE